MAEDDVEDLLQIDRRVRNEMAATEGQRIATEIMRRLRKDRTDMEALLKEGYRLARDMSWDGVVRKYLLNDLAGAFKEPAPHLFGNMSSATIRAPADRGAVISSRLPRRCRIPSRRDSR